MLGAIKRFFEEQIMPAGDQDDKQHALQLATAALMVEMMSVDHKVTDAEWQAVSASIGAKFNLSKQEAEELVRLAEQEHRSSTDYYQFTSLINKHFTHDQKVKVIEYLWHIAYADGVLDKYEEHMVRKIAELLYLPHSEFIRTKHRVAEPQSDN